MPGLLSLLGSGAVAFAELEVFWPVVTVLLVLALPLLVFHLANWAAALLLTPVVIFGRVASCRRSGGGC